MNFRLKYSIKKSFIIFLFFKHTICSIFKQEYAITICFSIDGQTITIFEVNVSSWFPSLIYSLSNDVDNSIEKRIRINTFSFDHL